MATIRKHTEPVFGKIEQFKINYSAKFKRFEVGLPKALEQYLKESEVDPPRGKTEAELLVALSTFLKNYEESSVKERKVILYKFEWSSKNIEGNIKNYRGYSDTSDEAKIEFVYHLLTEREVAGNKKYYENGSRWNSETGEHDTCLVESDIRYSHLNDMQVIDWSPESEAFLSNFYSSMEKLMESLKKFVGTKELLLKAVNSNVKLLEKL